MANTAILTVATGAAPTKLTAVGAVDNVTGNTLCLQNIGSEMVRLGGSDVATANGWPLPAGATLILDVAEDLYGVVDAGVAGQIAVLRVR